MSRKSFLITLAALAVVIAGLIVLNRQEDSRQAWDTVHPMVNTNVSWRQTYRAGAWSEVARR